MKMIKQLLIKLSVASAALILAACGGGAGGTGASLTTASSGSSSTLTPSLTLVAQTAAGIDTHSIAAGATVKARALFLGTGGVILPNAIVTFKLSSSTLATLSPIEGTALTDANGIASIDVTALAPNPGGAFSIQADAVSGTVTATAANWGLSVGAAAVVVGNASHTPISSSSSALQAGSTVTITADVTSSGNPVSSGVSFIASSACITQGKAIFTAIGVTNGVFTGSYKNTGCSASPDVVTLTQVGGTASTTVQIYTAPSSLAEILFVSVSPSTRSLVIKGGGGLGRVETGEVTFELKDNVGNAVAGQTVNFTLSSSAGALALDATSGVTGTDGKVVARVKSGTVPTPFVVSASVSVTVGTVTTLLSASSSVLNVSVGLPEQKNMSMSATAYNIEGLAYDGIVSAVTIRLADFWGNKVADGTAVNMITEGGVIGLSNGGACVTINGACSLDLSSQSFKPADGRVSVTAYTEGPVSFNDSTGQGNFTAPGTVCFHKGDPFLDVNEDLIRNETLSGTNAVVLYPNGSESYIPFSGSAYTPANPSAPCVPTGATMRSKVNIFQQSVFVFSGSEMYGASEQSRSSKRADQLSWPLTQSSFANGYYGDVSTVSCGLTRIPVRVFDSNFNPLPADTTFNVTGSSTLGTVKLSRDKMPSLSSKGGISMSVSVEGKCAAAVAPLTGLILPVGLSGEVVIEATTPKGDKSSFVITTVY